jgi:hypothetical protein
MRIGFRALVRARDGALNVVHAAFPREAQRPIA